MNDWKEGLPTKPGVYWLYSYRYGKIRRDRQADPEYTLITVGVNGIIVGDGNFVYASEVEEPHYMPAKYPEPPTLKATGDENES